ncbi:MAG: hypothetical protein R3F61_05760 [Myxococcota bacterium]
MTPAHDPIDDHIRRAFLAVELRDEVRDDLLRPEPRRRGRLLAPLLLAAVTLLTLTLAALPSDSPTWNVLLAGLRGPVAADAIPLDPLDRWIPAGSAVEVLEFGLLGTSSLGVQRLDQTGPVGEIAVLDPTGWGRGPTGYVRLARVDGPLRIVAIPPDPDRDAGITLIDGERRYIEYLATDADRSLIRIERDVLTSWSVLPTLEQLQQHWAGPFTSLRSTVEVPRREGIRPRDVLCPYDADSGMPLGCSRQSGQRAENGIVVSAIVDGGLDLSGRALRFATELPDDRFGLSVPSTSGAQPGDIVQLIDGDGLALDEVEVVVALKGRVRVSLTRFDVPRWVRVPGLHAELVAASATHIVDARLFEPDVPWLTQPPYELVAVGTDRVLSLGTATREDDVDTWSRTFSVARPLPPGWRPLHYRVVSPDGDAVRLNLITRTEAPLGPAVLERDGTSLAPVEILKATTFGTLVRVARSDLDAVLRADGGPGTEIVGTSD